MEKYINLSVSIEKELENNKKNDIYNKIYRLV